MKLNVFILLLISITSFAQDLTEGLIVNDLSLHVMQDIAKPDYLNSITDPSFGTTIRRITNTNPGEVIVPMYSTIQAWNADETLMILYNQSKGTHELLDGMNYQFIRELDDINPIDLEQIFWDFNNPNIFYYPERLTNDFVKYSIDQQSKESIVNLATLTSCNSGIELGNDIQMMSWDSDRFTFRCGNETSYAYRISTGELTTFDISNTNNTAPATAPSGNRFYHRNKVYDSTGINSLDLNKAKVEHSCIGKLPNGNDGYYAIAFEEGPQGGCLGDIIAHDLTTGVCTPVISQGQGYDYPQSGTHISALAHKNTEGGWIAASMVGYDRDGQELLDQELVIARAEEGNIQVCRIGHHRSDEDQFDYWGEPHAVISPTGTRVLFGSDWSGTEDGQSVDSYVVELPAFTSGGVSTTDLNMDLQYKLYPNPAKESLTIEINNAHEKMSISIYDLQGHKMISDHFINYKYNVNTSEMYPGVYFFRITGLSSNSITGSFTKE